MPIRTTSPSPPLCYEAPQFCSLCFVPYPIGIPVFYTQGNLGNGDMPERGPKSSSQASIGLKCMLGKRPGQEGMETLSGGSIEQEAGASVCSPSLVLCPQNVERLLETVGIKVSCLEAGMGAGRGCPMVQVVPIGPREWVVAVMSPASLNLHYFLDICPPGDC